MAFKYNPLSGQIEDQQQGPQGPAGTVSDTVAGGNAGEPAFRFQNDSDTGVYSAGVDTLGIATGGTQRVIINNTGELGVGTPDPFGPFHVRLATDKNIYFTTSVESASTISTVNDGGTGFPTLGFKSSDVYFANAGSNVLRIDTSGNLGIGTTTPTARLDVRRSDTDGKIVEFHQSSGYGIDIGSSVTDAYIASGYNQKFIIKTDPSSGPVTRLSITKDGNVGIGTDSPSKKLVVVSPAHDNGVEILAGGNDQSTSLRLQAKNGSTDQSWYLDSSRGTQALNIHDGTSTHLRIQSDGKVLIGTTSNRSINTHEPRLQVSGNDYKESTVSIINNANDATGPHLFFTKQRSGAAGGSTAVQENDILGDLRFTAGDGGDVESGAARITVRAAANATTNTTPGYITFSTSTTNDPQERLRITSDGKVGINGATTTGSRGRLDVRASGDTSSTLTAVFGANEGQAGGALSDNADKAARVGLYHYDRDEKAYALFSSGGTSSSNAINFGGGTSLMNAATSIGFYTAANTTTPTGSKRFEIDSDGNLEAISASNVRLTLGSQGVAGSNNSVYVEANGSDLKFNTALSGNTYFSSGTTSTVSILSSGNLGIGTTTPNEKLHIAAGGVIRFERSAGDRYGELFNDGSFVELKASGDPIRINAQSYIRFDIASTEKLRIDSSGRVGINVTNTGDYYSAADDLIIREAGGGDSGLTIRTGTAGSGLICFADGASSSSDQYRMGQIRYHHSNNSMDFLTNGNNTRVTIDGSGQVGIGVTSPARQLHVVSTNGTVAQIESSNANTYSQIAFKGSGVSTPPYVGAHGTAFQITTGDIERLRIDANGTAAFTGDLTLASDKYLKFNGNAFTIRENAGNNFINYTGAIYLQSGGTTKLEIKDTGRVKIGTGTGATPSTYYDDIIVDNSGTASGPNGATGVTLVSGSATWGSFSFSDSDADQAGAVKYDHSNDLMRFRVNHLPALEINSDLDMEPVGNIKMAATKGIQFGSTAGASHTLDDYEEGSFTATCANGVTLDSNFNTLTYTKIGRLVHVQGRLKVDNQSNSADFIIDNLPLAAVGETVGTTVIINWQDSLSSLISVKCKVSNGSNNLAIIWDKKNDTLTNLDADEDAEIVINISYVTST